MLSAPVVVNVTWPYSARVNRMAGVEDAMRIHTRPLRQEVFTARAPDGMRLEDGFPTVADLDLGQYIKPQVGGTWAIGGTEPECDELHWVDDPDRFDEYPSVEQFETSMLRVARRAPVFGIPLRPAGLAALYDVAEAMGTRLSLADTMALLAAKLTPLVPASTWALFLYDPSTGISRCEFATGVQQPKTSVGSGFTC